ncbi:MAG TPA: uroporphyrinogen-III synthase [Allosphingosinicella sp.]
MKLLILRPQPGAGKTAARAAARMLEPVVAPLFTVRPLDWDAPDPADVEGVLLTSANAARHAGEQLGAFIPLPCYAVGDATAAAAREAGFTDVRVGSSDGQRLIRMLASDGIVRALHLCGQDHIPLDHPQIALTRRRVYAADAVAKLPDEARRAIERGAVALIHSARAARLFARLVDEAGLRRDGTAVVAVSEAVAAAAGPGWRSKAFAPAPRDDALLELAAKLCQNEGERMGQADEC